MNTHATSPRVKEPPESGFMTDKRKEQVNLMSSSQAVVTSKSANKRLKKQKLEPIVAPFTTFVIVDGKKKGSRQPSEASSLM